MRCPSCRSSAASLHRPGGFTLIEVMVTVAIVAILASVAVPAYTNYVKRGKLPEAFNQLTGIAMATEQFYQDNRTYVGSPACSAIASTTNFSYAFSNCAATTYKVTATGISSSTTGFQFTLDQQGQRTTPAVPNGWTTSTACWVTNQSGTCQ